MIAKGLRGLAGIANDVELFYVLETAISDTYLSTRTCINLKNKLGY